MVTYGHSVIRVTVIQTYSHYSNFKHYGHSGHRVNGIALRPYFVNAISLSLYIYIYIYIYIHTHILISYSIHTYIYVNKHIYIYIYIHRTLRCPIITFDMHMRQKCTSKDIWRQGIVSKHRNSLQKSLCPVVICPYLCSSETRAITSLIYTTILYDATRCYTM